MSDGGISANSARRIAEQAADHAASAAESRMAAQLERVESTLQTQISGVAHRLSQLESEMSEIARAIQQMHSSLGERLSEVAATQRAVAARTQELVLTNAAGFTAAAAASVQAGENVQGTVQTVQTSVEKSTSAAVEMEYMRLFNEARAPIRQMREFANEIDERFRKAVEEIRLNRRLYDEHFHRVEGECDRKVRTIGKEIFRILEDEYDPAVEQRLSVPCQHYEDLALHVDRARIAMRAQQLDIDLDRFFDDEIRPLLAMVENFEKEISGVYGIDTDTEPQSLRVPADVAVFADGRAEVVMGSQVRADHKSVGGTEFRIVEDDRYASLRQRVVDQWDEVYETLDVRDASSDEVAGIKQSLQSLADSGQIQADMLPGYFDYLDSFGICFAEPAQGR